MQLSQYTLGGLTFILEEADITQFQGDMIVNAANESLMGGGGVDGAIHRAAGPTLLTECVSLKGCPTGEAKRTGAHQLKGVGQIVHAVGPRYVDGTHNEHLLLQQVMHSIMRETSTAKTFALPAISCGIFRFPLNEAIPIIMNTMAEYQDRHQTIHCMTWMSPEVKKAWLDWFNGVNAS